jgi:hypothetical protein
LTTATPATTRYRYDRMGIPAGYVCADPGHRDRGRVLMLERTALESVLKAANASQTEQLLIDGAPPRSRSPTSVCCWSIGPAVGE